MIRRHHMSRRWLEVVDGICRSYYLYRREVMSDSRSPRITACRHEIWSTLQTTFDASLVTIGWRFGEYHHTTILNGIRSFRGGGSIAGRPKATPYSAEEDDLIRETFADGYTDAEIAISIYGLSRRQCGAAAIGFRRRKLGLGRPPAGGFHPRTHHTTTEEQPHGQAYGRPAIRAD